MLVLWCRDLPLLIWTIRRARCRMLLLLVVFLLLVSLVGSRE